MVAHKILLADDSVSIQKVVELTFADEGFDVTTVGDGDAAMQKFVETQPDMVLVDVNMPGASGYQICEMIKQDESTKSIPVVLLVGSFEPFDQTLAEKVGADGYLTKPFHSIRELVTKVDELLGLDNGTPGPPSETADIDNLYHSSFAETVRDTKSGATDEYLGDAGMDDEMIVASYPADMPNDAGTAFYIPPTEQIDPFEAPAGEVEAVNGEMGERPVFEPRFLLEDEEAESLVRIDDEDDARGTNTGIPDSPNPSPQPEARELPAETINLIADKVIERLSDKVIREIAQDAVPRIAEKLIREALDEDKKQ